MSKSGQQDKSFAIPKQLVWEAYKRVKANHLAQIFGAVGCQNVPDHAPAARRQPCSLS